MTPRPTPVLVLTALVLAACTSTQRKIDPAPVYVPLEVHELQRFQIRSGGDVVGAAVKLELVDNTGRLRFWRFENQNGAWIGHATEFGRFSKRVPFQDDEEDLGVWPMATGVANLFDLRGPVQLREVAVAVPASAQKAEQPRAVARD